MPGVGQLVAVQRQVRVDEVGGRRALESVLGLPAAGAVRKLRFSPDRSAEPVARVIDRALVGARSAGLTADQLVVVGGSVEAAEDIVRVRRKAHGTAGWIRTPTCDIRVELLPAGLHAAERTRDAADLDVDVADIVSAVSPCAGDPAGARQVRQALFDVIDPDLGVNIVDLGFVRGVHVDVAGVATITMTLTSAACPLTGVMDDQIRSLLLADGPQPLATDYRIVWQWVPAWQPTDISEEGREQLRAIGFNV
jgi:metal-sulfur cluster biosynthetic enzyme/ribosomal protein L22